MANVAYVRVSTIEQNEARQLEALQKYSIDKWFTEKVSGKNTNRPELQKMLEYVREGDTVYVHDFSRLARNTKDLLTIVESLNNRGISLVSNKEGLDSSTPTGKLMLTMIGAIAEFERQNLLERQREGIEIAKREGKYKGRKAVEIENFDEYYQKYKNREYSKASLAKELGISRPTLDKLISEHTAFGQHLKEQKEAAKTGKFMKVTSTPSESREPIKITVSPAPTKLYGGKFTIPSDAE